MTFNNGNLQRGIEKSLRERLSTRNRLGTVTNQGVGWGNNLGSVGQTLNNMRGLNVAVSQRQGRFSPRGKGGNVKDWCREQSETKSLSDVEKKKGIGGLWVAEQGSNAIVKMTENSDFVACKSKSYYTYF